MGASFRNLGEITELAGCDLLTISPALLGELQGTVADLPRKLAPDKAATTDIQKITVDQATFNLMHESDRMASEKLEEGITGFTKALEALESLLADRLSKLQGQETFTQTTGELFHIYDLDGDGFITREEWMGTDAVFDALDVNHDGKITPQEMEAGLGALLQLASA